MNESSEAAAPRASDAILDRLLALHPKAIDLSLGRMTRLLDALGNPERAAPPVVHVAGTNGKGSVVAYLEAMLIAAGYRVNGYVSPHLVRFAERIRLGGRPIAEEPLRASLAHCEAVNDGAPITFFEITTAAAFHAFRHHRADLLLLEVGLGGRLDATNVIARPALSVITPVSIDHTHYLGETLALIAAEKAGILKQGVTGVIGRQEAEAAAAIERAAAAAGAPLARLGREWSFARAPRTWRCRTPTAPGAIPCPRSPARTRSRTRRWPPSAPAASSNSPSATPPSAGGCGRRAGPAGSSASPGPASPRRGSSGSTAATTKRPRAR